MPQYPQVEQEGGISMTLAQFQQKYPNPKDGYAAVAKMSRDEIKQIIDSAGISQAKIAIKQNWEKLTGKKY